MNLAFDILIGNLSFSVTKSTNTIYFLDKTITRSGDENWQINKNNKIPIYPDLDDTQNITKLCQYVTRIIPIYYKI